MGVNLAEHDFDEALRLRPKDADALIGRAEVQVRLGRVKDALAVAEEALNNLPRGASPTARLQLRYNAARVFAQATATAPDPSAVLARTANLLREVLEDVPKGDRAGFWKDVVMADPPLARISRSPALLAVAAEAEGR